MSMLTGVYMTLVTKRIGVKSLVRLDVSSFITLSRTLNLLKVPLLCDRLQDCPTFDQIRLQDLK